MGKFTDIKYNNLNTAVLNIKKDLLKNPFHIFSGINMTPVKYYKINREKSTMDEAMDIIYDISGKDSPLRFDIINNFIIGGVDTVDVSLDNTEIGLHASEISGDGVILPRTIKPIPGEFFEILHANNNYLFQITSVTPDTLYNGDNYYKINYELRYQNNKSILKLIINTYDFIVLKDGTDTKYNIVEKNHLELIKNFEELNDKYRRFYIDKFYNEYFCTTMYYNKKSDDLLYDPYLTEFIKRNKVLDIGDGYIYYDKITALNVSDTNYNLSWLHAFENKDIDEFVGSLTVTYATDVPNNIMSHVPHNVLYMKYIDENVFNLEPFFIFDTNFHNAIVTDDISSIDMEHLDNMIYIYYIIIDYFNGRELNVENLNHLKLMNINFEENTFELFYYLPLLIYIIDQCIKNYINRRKNL